jgi:hypothetical protein
MLSPPQRAAVARSLGGPRNKGPCGQLALSPADFGKLIAAETEKWGKVIKSAGIKAD